MGGNDGLQKIFHIFCNQMTPNMQTFFFFFRDFLDSHFIQKKKKKNQKNKEINYAFPRLWQIHWNFNHELKKKIFSFWSIKNSFLFCFIRS